MPLVLCQCQRLKHQGLQLEKMKQRPWLEDVSQGAIDRYHWVPGQLWQFCELPAIIGKTFSASVFTHGLELSWES